MGMARAFSLPGHFLTALHPRDTIRVSGHFLLELCSKQSHADVDCDGILLKQNLFHSPESPRWLVHEGFYDSARTVVAQTNTNGDLNDPVSLIVYKEIVDTLEWEKKEGRTMNPKEIIKTPTARKRLLIGSSAGPFSCIAGNIIASYYLGDELVSC